MNKNKKDAVETCSLYLAYLLIQSYSIMIYNCNRFGIGFFST